METVYATRFDMPIGPLRNRVFVFCMIFLTNRLFFCCCSDAVFSV